MLAASPPADSAFGYRIPDTLTPARAVCRRLARQRRAQLEVVAVRVAEVDRAGWHPVVGDRSRHLDAALAQLRGGALDVRLARGEGEVQGGPIPGFLLEHEHPGLAASAQEVPASSLLPKPRLQTEDVQVERLRPLQVLDGDRDLVDSMDGGHGALLSGSRSIGGGTNQQATLSRFRCKSRDADDDTACRLALRQARPRPQPKHSVLLDFHSLPRPRATS